MNPTSATVLRTVVCAALAAILVAGCSERSLEPKAGGGTEEEWISDGATRLAWSPGKGTARLVLRDGAQRFSFPILIRADVDQIGERLRKAWDAPPDPAGPAVIATISAGTPEIQFIVEASGQGKVVRMHMHDGGGPPGVFLELTEERYTKLLDALEAAKPGLRESL